MALYSIVYNQSLAINVICVLTKGSNRTHWLKAWIPEGIMLREKTEKDRERQRKTNTAHPHLYIESKVTKLIELESRMIVSRGQGLGELGRYWSKSTNPQL